MTRHPAPILLRALPRAAGLAALLLLPLAGGCDRAGVAPSGQIQVSTTPDGAAIQVDGVDCGTAPLTVENLAAGTHLVSARREGFEEARRSVNLLAGQRMAVELTLAPTLGLVLVHSQPPGATVEIGGVYRGETPLMIHDFPLGDHRVKFTQSGCLDREVALAVRDRIPLKLDVELTPNTGILAVSSTPPGAAVRVNGVERGATPATIADAPTGSLRLDVALAGHHPHSERIDLAAGQRLEVHAQLRPMPSSLQITSTPTQARVYINNEFRGLTPFQQDDVSPGTYLVRLELAGHASAERSVRIAATERRSEEFRMEKNSGMLVIVTEPADVRVFVDGRLRGTTVASGASDVVSEPFEIDMIEAGVHTVQLSKRGYTYTPRQIRIEPNKIVSLHEKLTRLFIPDTRVRLGAGAGQVHEGVLVLRHPNGDVELEVRPGVTARFRADEILSIEPLRTQE